MLPLVCWAAAGEPASAIAHTAIRAAIILFILILRNRGTNAGANHSPRDETQSKVGTIPSGTNGRIPYDDKSFGRDELPQISSNELLDRIQSVGLKIRNTVMNRGIQRTEASRRCTSSLWGAPGGSLRRSSSASRAASARRPFRA